MKALERIFLTVVACILAFILGFLSFIGAIVGVGYLAVTKVSVDKLEELGLIDIDTSELLDASADVSLTALTVQGLIQEISELSGLGETVTINFLIDRYGLKLDEEILSYIPETLRDVPLAQIFSLDGINVLLDSVPVSYVLQYLPDGILSEPAKAQLGDKTLKDVVALDLGYLLDGVCVGYLLEVNYELVDGEYKVVFADPDNPTLFELIAPIELGSVLTSISSGGDIVGALTADIQGVMLESIVNAAMGSDPFALPGLFEGKTVADIIVVDEETGMSSLEIGALLEGRTLGDLLGYEPIYHEDSVVGWTDSDGQPVSGVMRGLAGVSVEGVLDEGFDFSTLVSDIYIGDVLEYTPVYDETGAIVDWLDAEGQPVEGMYKDFASKTISELSDGGFSIDTILGEDTKVGEPIGYKYDEENDQWLDENGVVLTGAVAVFAALTFSELGDSTIVSEKINEMKLADALGYKWNEEDGKWYSGEEPVTGIMAVLADSQIGTIGTDVNNIEIGRIMGYEWNEEDDKWYNSEKQPLTGVMAAFADLTVSGMSDSAKVSDRIQSVKLADALGYEWNEAEGKWYNGDEPVTGVMKVVADSSIGNVSEKINESSIGDILGYEKRGDTWYDGDEPVSNLVATISDSNLENMGDTLTNLTLGNVLSGDAFNSGFLQLANPEWKITELGTEMNNMFTTTTMGDYHSKGIIKLEDDTVETLDALDKISHGTSWRETTIDGFIDHVVGALGNLMKQQNQ